MGKLDRRSSVSWGGWGLVNIVLDRLDVLVRQCAMWLCSLECFGSSITWRNLILPYLLRGEDVFCLFCLLSLGK